MKNVLIVGEVYSDNLGDGVICQVVNKFLAKNYNTRYFDLSGRTSYCIKENRKKFNYIEHETKVIKRKIKKILEKCGYKKKGKNLKGIVNKSNENFKTLINEYKPDYIVFAGGQMFLDSFINQIEFICKYANENNISVAFNACGLGEMSKSNILQAKGILESECVKYISVRDGIEKLEKITEKKIYDTYDTAILANSTYKVEKQKSNDLGVGIMLTYKKTILSQVIFWKKMLKGLIKQKKNFKIFTNGSYTDQLFAKYLLKKVNLDEEKYLMNKPNNPEELINTITSYNQIISMRLHSLIIAYSYDIPAIAISWDKKVNAFFDKINRHNLCFNLFDCKKILNNKVEKYDFDKRKEIIEKIEENLENIKSVLE